MDRKFSELDTDCALRPTIIKPGPTWTKTSQDGLLSLPKTDILSINEQEREKQRAFDLLDALSRSGSLTADASSLHIMLCATHCFDKSLMDSVICDNMNPIEKVY